MSQIVHIGPGAFHRAHQAVYTEDANDGWQITGVSLRSTGIVSALNAQGGRYTLVTRGATGTDYRVMKVHTQAYAAVCSLGSIKRALLRPETQIVSLTITEKGYSAPFGQDSAIGLVVEALQARKTAGKPALTLMSCDNLSGNGAVLRKAVLGAAGNTELADWIETHARFPSTMVDRITPATTDPLRAEVARATGWTDQIPVETEAFSQWVIEDSFCQDRPAWEAVGAQIVNDVAPYEEMKLRMLNGAHSMLAYAGHLAGKRYVRDVMADQAFAHSVARHIDAAAATLDPPAGLDTEAYRNDLVARFRNPHIAHETYQIAMDGSQKMPQRIFSPALSAIERGQDVAPFAFATALWAQYLGGRTDAGAAYALRDPREAELRSLPSDPDARVAALFALPGLVPPKLADDDGFRLSTAALLQQICQQGVLATIQDAGP